MQTGRPTSNRRNLLILSFTLVVVMLGFGMVVPVFPFFVQRLGAGGGALGLLVATRRIRSGDTITVGMAVQAP